MNPRIDPNDQTVMASLRMPQSLRDALQQRAEQLELTFSEYLRWVAAGALEAEAEEAGDRQAA